MSTEKWAEVKDDRVELSPFESVDSIIRNNSSFLMDNVGRSFSYKGYSIKINGIEEDLTVLVDDNKVFCLCYDNIEKLLYWNERVVKDIFS